MVAQLKNSDFDVLIVGGGITGAGIALDAVTRGMKVALVEMQDFAGGTSSRSTKLIHGGLRYLKQFEFNLVASVGKERSIVYENGPHVTKPEWMLLPIYQGGSFGKLSTSLGLRIYDFLAGVKKNERRLMLNRLEALQKEPLLKQAGLMGAGFYVEYRTDDARLTIEVIKESVDQGALAINYAKVVSLHYQEEKIVGAAIVDLLSGEAFDIRAKIVVNATGPWGDQLLRKDPYESNKKLKLTKGVHIVVDQVRFPLQQAVYFDTSDGRMVFAIPRDGKIYVGTTDTFCQQAEMSPKITMNDRKYLIDSVNEVFPGVALANEDIESSWAGLRPLIYQEGKGPSEISRRDEVWESHTGFLTIAGGKLTGYRKMAQEVVDRIAKRLIKNETRQFKPCQTKSWPISGGRFQPLENASSFFKEQTDKGIRLGFTPQESKRLTATYGANIKIIYQLIENDINEGTSDLPLHLKAQLSYAIEHEMVANPSDFFLRRTGLLLFSVKEVLKWKDSVIEYMARSFSWTEQEINQHSQDLVNEVMIATHSFEE